MRCRMVLLIISLSFIPLLAMAQDALPAADVRGYRADVAQDVIGKLTSQGKSPGEVLAELDQLPNSLRFDGSHKGDRVEIYCFYYEDINPQTNEEKTAEVRTDEKKRQPLVAGQLKTLRGIAEAIAAAAAGQREIKVEHFPRDLRLERAEFKITAEIKLNAQNPVLPTEEKAAKWFVVFDFTRLGTEPVNTGRTEATILTGPREGWSLSADVPVTTFGDVKVDDDGEDVELEKTPDAFYVGFNYTPWGDVLRKPANLKEAISVKALLNASRRPTDSFGIGVGLRAGLFSDSASPFRIFNVLSPYVAYTRTRVEETTTNDDGTTQKHRFKRYDFSFGVSLNLDRALDFIKARGGDEEEGEGGEGSE